MKKWTLLLAVVMMAAYAPPARGQAAILVLLFGEKVASENFYFSLKVGVNVADVSGVDGGSVATGINFGLLASIKISDKFSLIPEFAPLSRKGVKDIPYLPSGIAELDNLITPPSASQMSLNYIDIPVIAKYQLSEKLSIGTGPQFGILTSSSNTYDNAVQPDDVLRYTQESQLSWNTFDFGWAFELTYGLGHVREGRGLNLHARYTRGLTDILQDNPGDAVNNSVFQFFVSLPFIEIPENGS